MNGWSPDFTLLHRGMDEHRRVPLLKAGIQYQSGKARCEINAVKINEIPRCIMYMIVTIEDKLERFLVQIKDKVILYCDSFEIWE